MLSLALSTPMLLYVDPTHEQPRVEAATRSRGIDTILLSRTEELAGCELGDGRIVSPVPPPGGEAAWAAATLPPNAEICGVLAGDDGALADAERLAHALCPARANGIMPARRDKFLMNEALRAAGVPTAAQIAPTSWQQARRFLRHTSGLPAIVKPRRGVASILVGLAHTEAEAESMYSALAAAPGANGAESAEGADGAEGSPVLQERLDGEEWIVDTVSGPSYLLLATCYLLLPTCR